MVKRVLGAGDLDRGIPAIIILINDVEAEAEPLPFQAALATALAWLP